MASTRFTLDKEDALKILKTFLFSVASVALGSAMLMLQKTQVPVEYAAAIPLINSALVALKNFIDDHEIGT